MSEFSVFHGSLEFTGKAVFPPSFVYLVGYSVVLFQKCFLWLLILFYGLLTTNVVHYSLQYLSFWHWDLFSDWCPCPFRVPSLYFKYSLYPSKISCTHLVLYLFQPWFFLLETDVWDYSLDTCICSLLLGVLASIWDCLNNRKYINHIYFVIYPSVYALKTMSLY